MSEITFSREEKTAIAAKIRAYVEREMDWEIGGFEAEFLLDFFASEIGAYFYNRGLQDAQAVVTAKLSEISEAIDEIEKPAH